MGFSTILMVTSLTCVVGGTVYSVFNSSDKFATYKLNFNKKYPNLNVEKGHFINFLGNLNRVTKLNENSKDKKTTYVLNKYADLDPTEVQEHYSINLVPYTKLTNGENNLEVLRTNPGIEISNSNLYDLTNAEALYKKYQIDNGIKITSEYDRITRYYRFIKSLVEKNREIMKGKSDLRDPLSDQADVIQHEDEFFY